MLLDIKSWDPERHRSLPGWRLVQCWILRDVWPPEKTDLGALCAGARTNQMSKDIAQIAKFAASLGNVERVDVLPFHQMGDSSGRNSNSTTP